MPARKSQAEGRSSVVILDDEESYVDLMADMIAENLDCDVHAFTRPEAALAQLEEIQAAVVVTDYFMPQMDGVEFIRRATALTPTAVFIMISGHDLDHVEHELRRLKRLKKRLQKPFGWKPLAEAVIEVWPGDDAPSYLQPQV
jgi:DNA-binding NtrC family response regulator